LPIITLGDLTTPQRAATLGLAVGGSEAADESLLAGVLASAAARDDFFLVAAVDDSPDKESLGSPIQAAVLAQVLAGRTAVVWPPQAAEPHSAGPRSAKESRLLALALLAAVHAELASRGVHLAQVVAEPGVPPPDDFWQAAGYREAGDLCYMAIPVGSPNQSSALELPFALEVAPPDDARLAAILAETYRGSLDCPLVDGLREPADVLAGYRTVGSCRPEWWLIARAGGQDVGCLIVADHPEQGHAELVYLGIAPPWRGQAWGRHLTAAAQRLAAGAGRHRLVLAVDERNRPARTQYAAAGGVVWDTRRIWICDLRNPQVSK
jgi:ribosomal protein S18 acetylase RimI-like enzyme